MQPLKQPRLHPAITRIREGPPDVHRHRLWPSHRLAPRRARCGWLRGNGPDPGVRPPRGRPDGRGHVVAHRRRDCRGRGSDPLPGRNRSAAHGPGALGGGRRGLCRRVGAEGDDERARVPARLRWTARAGRSAALARAPGGQWNGARMRPPPRAPRLQPARYCWPRGRAAHRFLRRGRGVRHRAHAHAGSGVSGSRRGRHLAGRGLAGLAPRARTLTPPGEHCVGDCNSIRGRRRVRCRIWSRPFAKAPGSIRPACVRRGTGRPRLLRAVSKPLACAVSNRPSDVAAHGS